MHPRLWRLLISASLRLFLGVTATVHGTLLIGLAAFVIAFLVPPPKPAGGGTTR